MPWIESHTELERHRKCILMAGELGIKPVHLSGHLHALWHTVLEQQEDGDLSQWPDSLIASAAQYDGDATRFVALLRLHKLLDGHLIHDWLDYAGKYLTAKYRTGNPAKLKAIYKRHKSVFSPTKVRYKSAHQPSQPNITKPTGPIKIPVAQPLPEWLPVETWNSFRVFRKEIRKPLTAKGEELAIKKLAGLRAGGQDVVAVIEQSIASNYQGLFAVSEQRLFGEARQPKGELSERTKRILERGL